MLAKLLIKIDFPRHLNSEYVHFFLAKKGVCISKIHLKHASFNVRPTNLDLYWIFQS